ncbi:DUF433 domain-containing protein, partial [Candidatus Protofrankia californiensis]|uniref:DUF433 domain-containing protein n=1 Tax=Candidatus Protofrankia californiensis TaxID=1839754 RepID=UPI0013EB4957
MDVINLLERPFYGMSQADRILLLPAGTTRRWVDGYRRGDTAYPPVIRPASTGDDTVTWGKFVETRLLAGFRARGVPLIRLRPAIEMLRERFDTRYPLAHARPFVAGKDLVLAVQEDVGLDRELCLVVVRTGQRMLNLSTPAEAFFRSTEFTDDEDGVARLIRPILDVDDVVIDPLRGFGEPVVRNVPTEVIAEQVRAGDPPEMVADLFELSPMQVNA